MIRRYRSEQEAIAGVITSVIKFQKKIFTEYHLDQLIKTNACEPSNELEDWSHTRIDLNKALIRNPEESYFIEVLGDSMKDSRIYNSEIVIVDKSLPISNNDIIAARINGEVTLKRYEHDLRPKLVPSNPMFKKIDIPYNESITDGVVIASIQRLRKV